MKMASYPSLSQRGSLTLTGILIQNAKPKYQLTSSKSVDLTLTASNITVSTHFTSRKNQWPQDLFSTIASLGFVSMVIRISVFSLDSWWTRTCQQLVRTSKNSSITTFRMCWTSNRLCTSSVYMVVWKKLQSSSASSAWALSIRQAQTHLWPYKCFSGYSTILIQNQTARTTWRCSSSTTRTCTGSATIKPSTRLTQASNLVSRSETRSATSTRLLHTHQLEVTCTYRAIWADIPVSTMACPFQLMAPTCYSIKRWMETFIMNKRLTIWMSAWWTISDPTNWMVSTTKTECSHPSSIWINSNCSLWLVIISNSSQTTWTSTNSSNHLLVCTVAQASNRIKMVHPRSLWCLVAWTYSSYSWTVLWHSSCRVANLIDVAALPVANRSMVNHGATIKCPPCMMAVKAMAPSSTHNTTSRIEIKR